MSLATIVTLVAQLEGRCKLPLQCRRNPFGFQAFDELILGPTHHQALFSGLQFQLGFCWVWHGGEGRLFCGGGPMRSESALFCWETSHIIMSGVEKKRIWWENKNVILFKELSICV